MNLSFLATILFAAMAIAGAFLANLVVLGTGSLVLGAWLGPSGGGPGIALLGVIGAMWMVDRAERAW